MLVYFHIDELARDAVTASAVRKEFKKHGARVVYGNRFITDYLLRYFNVFDAVILTSLAHYYIAFPNAQKLPNNVFILPTEAIGQATGTLRRIYGKYFGDNHEKYAPWHSSVAGFLLWGHAHVNPFEAYFPAYLLKVRVVGHPRLADACKKTKKPEPHTKPVIGFVSRFGLLSPHDGRTPFESALSSMKFGKEVFPLFENSPDRDVEDLFFTEVIDFRVMYQILATLDANKYDIHVRPHPRENRQSWMRLAEKLNLKVTISRWDEPFGHWLERVDMIVTPPSTSLYDIFFHGKKPIVISHIVPARGHHILTESDDNNQILEATCRPTSVDEVIRLISSGDIPFDKEKVEKRLYEQVGADIAHNSIATIFDALQDLLAGRPPAESRLWRQLKCHVFVLLGVALSHLKWLSGKLKGRIEQGSSFDMTLKRLYWIHALTK